MQLFNREQLRVKLNDLQAKISAAGTAATLNKYQKFSTPYVSLEELAQLALVLGNKTHLQDAKDSGAVIFVRTPKRKGTLTTTIKVYRKKDGSATMSVMNGGVCLAKDLVDQETGEVVQESGQELNLSLFGWVACN
jgi:hypothetical protein